MQKININNFRTLSGYTNKNGQKIIPNIIYRGGALNLLSEEEAKYFEEDLKIRQI